MIALVSLVLCLVSKVFAANASSTTHWLLAVWDQPEIQVLSTVQRITYAGGMFVRTKIDTDAQSLLLDGVVHLPLQAAIELRTYRLQDDAVVR